MTLGNSSVVTCIHILPCNNCETVPNYWHFWNSSIVTCPCIYIFNLKNTKFSINVALLNCSNHYREYVRSWIENSFRCGCKRSHWNSLGVWNKHISRMSLVKWSPIKQLIVLTVIWSLTVYISRLISQGYYRLLAELKKKILNWLVLSLCLHHYLHDFMGQKYTWVWILEHGVWWTRMNLLAYTET